MPDRGRGRRSERSSRSRAGSAASGTGLRRGSRALRRDPLGRAAGRWPSGAVAWTMAAGRRRRRLSQRRAQALDPVAGRLGRLRESTGEHGPLDRAPRPGPRAASAPAPGGRTRRGAPIHDSRWNQSAPSQRLTRRYARTDGSANHASTSREGRVAARPPSVRRERPAPAASGSARRPTTRRPRRGPRSRRPSATTGASRSSSYHARLVAPTSAPGGQRPERREQRPQPHRRLLRGIVDRGDDGLDRRVPRRDEVDDRRLVARSSPWRPRRPRRAARRPRASAPRSPPGARRGPA